MGLPDQSGGSLAPSSSTNSQSSALVLPGNAGPPIATGAGSEPSDPANQTASSSGGSAISDSLSASSRAWGADARGIERHKSPAIPPYSIFRRDHVIMIDCLLDRIVVFPGAVNYDLYTLSKSRSGEMRNTVLRQVARWASAAPAGETPPRVEIHFRVRPDGLRAYYTAYPILEDLRLPMIRENVEEGVRQTP